MLHFVFTALISFFAGAAVMFFERQHAINAARTAELLAKAKLSLVEAKLHVFAARVRGEVDKLEDVPAHALAAIRNLIHGTAAKAGKTIEKL